MLKELIINALLKRFDIHALVDRNRKHKRILARESDAKDALDASNDYASVQRLQSDMHES